METGLISVDRWKRGSQAYFLTHMHSDHTLGLCSDWSHGPLFCSPTTASLFPSRFPAFDLSLIRVVTLSSWIPLSLSSPASAATVRLHFMAIDAHHCPGSVMFLFRGDFGCFLYTGDFRWDSNCDEAKSTLVHAVNHFPVDVLYLDNTYCNPVYHFPSRHLAACLVADIIASHPSHDVIIGIDSLGKEELLVHISRILNIKIWVWPERLHTLHLLGFKDIFTTDTTVTRVRAVPRHSFSIQAIVGLNTMCPTIGIMPSGLPWMKRLLGGDQNLSGSLLTASYYARKKGADGDGAIQTHHPRNNVQRVHKFRDYMYSVQYSDHSCFEEIGDFIKLVHPKSMKGIVASSSCYVDPLYYFGRICGTCEPPECLFMRPDRNTEETKRFQAIRIKSYSGTDETGPSEMKTKGKMGWKGRKGKKHGQVKCAQIWEMDCSD